MTVQEIFNTTAVRRIEEQILSLYHETERNHWYNDENKKAIRCLLELRKQILNSMFVLDEHSKQLLAEFNEAMKQQLAEMRKRAIDLYNNVYKPDISWIETYINYIDQMVDNFFWLVLPYGIKRFYTKKVEESETGAYTYVLNDDLQSRGFKTHNDVYSFIASKHDQIQKELEERLTQIDFKSTNFIEYSDMRAYSYT